MNRLENLPKDLLCFIIEHLSDYKSIITLLQVSKYVNKCTTKIIIKPPLIIHNFHIYCDNIMDFYTGKKGLASINYNGGRNLYGACVIHTKKIKKYIRRFNNNEELFRILTFLWWIPPLTSIDIDAYEKIRICVSIH
jgi:hypothetical protein